ncbi:MAG: hypothetical protein PUP93_12700 [Rhizonema sp. NSF051]|nr:hypothetical protein [Rhizonema sp. NSF051]
MSRKNVAAAVAEMAIQATALGSFIHQMAGFDVPKAKEVYSRSEGYEPVAAIALGYVGIPESLSEKLLQRELALRSRKPLEAFVFSGSWNQASPLVTNQDEKQDDCIIY